MPVNRPCQLLLLATLLTGAHTASAGCLGDDFRSLLAGVSTGALATAGNGQHGLDLRASVNAALLFANAGVDISSATGDTTVLGGVGFGQLLQLQYGYGEHAHVMRLRSELPLDNLEWRLGNTPVYPRLLLTVDGLRSDDANVGDYRIGAGFTLGW